MTQQNHDIARWDDIPAALGLLTRLPISVDTDAATKRGAASAWAYPLAGATVATIACTLTAAALWLGLPIPLAAALLLAIQIILTGAMHEDGLADCADGLWGGWTPERRLEIMKDSAIGAYGTLALILSLILRWQALTLILPHSLWAAPIAAATLSRAPMVALMAALPHARSNGLSQSVGRPNNQTAALAAASALLACLLLTGFATTTALAVTLILVTLACARIATAKINGQTGDILGATQQLSEITALATLATLIG